MGKPSIVILGAGYGGLVTALRLQKELHYNEADVTIVNKHAYHYITTHLHMPAAGTDHPHNARVNLNRILDESRTNIVKATVRKIRLEDKKVLTDDAEIPFDYLVIGLGGEPEYFGIPGMKEYAMTIRSINSVNLIREHIEYQFTKYKREPDRLDYLTFVVGGAGFTGIEFVGELADRVPKLCHQNDVDPSLVKIYSVEAAPTALPGFDPELVEYAVKVLEGKGVEFRVGTAIKECRADGVVLATGEEIKSATVVWTGGVRGNSLVEKAGIETMRGRVKVDEYLRVPGMEHIFVVGDCSIVFNEEGRPYPPTAQIAMQQAYTCAYNLAAAVRGEQPKPFKPVIRGTVASLGKNEAIGIIGGTKLKGLPASVMKKIIDARYLYTIGGISLVLQKAKW